jgi:hypothetical protein
MGPYSHYVLAAKLAPVLQPRDPEAYAWGSIIPDIRYLAGMRRDHTHLSRAHLINLTARYPHLKSFLLGYQVHCLIDEIDVSCVVGAAFPLNAIRRVLRRNLSQQQVTMLVEMYFLQNSVTDAAFTGSHNEVLDDLGITPDQTGTFSQAMQAYLRARSLDAAISAFKKIGMIENGRLEKYQSAYERVKRSKLMNAILVLSVKNARLEAHATNHVLSSLQVW